MITTGVLLGAIIFGAWWLLNRRSGGRDLQVIDFIRNPQAHQDWVIKAGTRCTLTGSPPSFAPFQFPTNGFIGYLWGDSFYPGHRHQGIDIFGGSEPGKTPVIAAFDGFLTRLADWKSTVIVRVPSDPVQPGRQIWTYYTHLASPAGQPFISDAFSPGTREVFIKAGTFLGYQGNYSGTPGNPTGVHLHFSIVLDDGSGSFRNELEILNTLDPSPYFGLPLNAAAKPGPVVSCP